MPNSSPNLARLETDIHATHQPTRFLAMSELVRWVQTYPSIGPQASTIFRAVIRQPPDGPTTVSALGGLEQTDGLAAAKEARLALFSDPRPDIVASVVAATHDPADVPPLLALLSQRHENEIQIAALRALGRLNDPAAMPAMLQRLAVPALRPYVVEALADLGDPAAIAYLQPLLNDMAPAWKEDNHGPMLRVCDLAGSAIARLRSQQRTPRVPPPSPVGQHAAILTPAVASASAERLSTTRLPPRPRLYGPSPVVPLLAAAQAWPWRRFGPYLPLLAALLEIPWAILIAMSQMGGRGNYQNDPMHDAYVTRALKIPASLGLLVGLYVLIRYQASGCLSWTCLILGCLICGWLVFS